VGIAVIKQFFQYSVLHAYQIVKNTGILTTPMGQKLSKNAYFLYKNIYEPNLNHLKEMIKPGSTIIDVGANIGFHSIKFSRWLSNKGLVIAIEPEPMNVQTLKQMLLEKKITNVEVVNGAAAEKEGTLYLQLNPLNPADHRLSAQGIPIEAFTIDNLLHGKEYPPVSLIKIDVQGAEPRVLKGAKKIIAQYKPIIFIEIDDEALNAAGFTSNGLIALLRSYGYDLWDEKNEQTRQFSKEDDAVRKKLGYADYIFIHNDK
jgi:FkbM family methyltransferase